MKHDPAHTAEVEMLLLLGQETGERLLARNMSPTTRRVVMAGLKRLMNALLKQRRHLQNALGPPEGLIEVRMGGDALLRLPETTGKLINPAKEQSPTSHEYLNNACFVGLERRKP